MPRTSGHIGNLTKIVKKEPVITAGTAATIVSLLAAFGLDLTAEQVTVIGTFVMVVLVPLVRHFVTPTAKQPEHRAE